MKIETKRCVLNLLKKIDYEDIKLLYSDYKTRLYLGGIIESGFEKKFDDLLNDDLAYHWVVRSKENSYFIGLITIDSYHNGLEKEVSYQLLSKHFKKGFGSEILSAVLDFSFENLKLKKIVAETQENNKDSICLLQKHGFVLEKKLERYGEKQRLYFLNKKV